MALRFCHSRKFLRQNQNKAHPPKTREVSCMKTFRKFLDGLEISACKQNFLPDSSVQMGIRELGQFMVFFWCSFLPSKIGTWCIGFYLHDFVLLCYLCRYDLVPRRRNSFTRKALCISNGGSRKIKFVWLATGGRRSFPCQLNRSLDLWSE